MFLFWFFFDRPFIFSFKLLVFRQDCRWVTFVLRRSIWRVRLERGGLVIFWWVIWCLTWRLGMDLSLGCKKMCGFPTFFFSFFLSFFLFPLFIVCVPNIENLSSNEETVYIFLKLTIFLQHVCVEREGVIRRPVFRRILRPSSFKVCRRTLRCGLFLCNVQDLSFPSQFSPQWCCSGATLNVSFLSGYIIPIV